MSRSALFESYSKVKPEWIDYNGHLNMGYYLVVFDEVATDKWFDSMGIGIAHKQTRNRTTFTLASNIDYIREVNEGDPLRFTTQLLDWDHKRLHYIHYMYNDRENYLAATNECLSMYIDLETRRSTEFEEDLQATFTRVWDAHKQLPVPDAVGRKLGIRR